MDASSKVSASTPGPWSLSGPSKGIGRGVDDGGYYAILAGGEIIAEAICRTNESVYQPALENARLIAAAPDLLEACEEALNALVGCAIPAGGVDDRKHILDAQMTLHKAINKAYDHQG